MALGSTQPLVKMSTNNISWDKVDRCVRLTTSRPSRAECHEIWEPKLPGTLWPTPGLLRDCFTFRRMNKHNIILMTCSENKEELSIWSIYFQKKFADFDVTCY